MPVTELPAGIWDVVVDASTLGFSARGMFGLAAVNGRFREFEGTLSVAGDDVRGELRIRSATLDTQNARRDKHLRSGDFFDVEEHPIVTFELTELKPRSAGEGGVSGVLRIGDNASAIDTPVEINLEESGRLTLSATLDVDRAAAGVGWSKTGMIKGPAHLTAKVVLARRS